MATEVFQEVWKDCKEAKEITFKQYVLETNQISHIQEKIKQRRQSLVNFEAAPGRAPCICQSPLARD